MTMRPFALVAIAASLVLLTVQPASAGEHKHKLSWQLQSSGTTAQLRGLDPVDHRVAWASGSAGTVLRTVDGGKTWQNVSPKGHGTEELEFRDIEAFDAKRAVILSIGNGPDSRIYRTSDGGKTWKESFRNDVQAAFYDCLAFSDSKHGLALSDPVDGKFRIASTKDGGRSWKVNDPKRMPAALEGEFAFAASGTCLVAGRGGHAWFATGGGAQTRVFRSSDGGRSWKVTATPFVAGPSAGIYSLAFKNSREGIAVGGDYNAATATDRIAAVTKDGGKTWKLAKDNPGGYRSGSTWVSWSPVALAVGPTGSDISTDRGRSWREFDTGSFDAVQCTKYATCWASGEKGRIGKLSLK
ncbi:WD40/YVTN/BNR-like repeat-containing protein [Tenggerimyces flavus]|uniref:WD40/YVTN/BNR-like repeat-containing protein n=1 Tax=Tenggerimyces flavus TaxID=1708749 RepID=A0ABV7YIW0_9ACTN|nr:oxidoreductase [Tenggerimyces flavus]MBM7784582.1 photosystem II stability/assembly factor-like uncharacterized protein [Tenggerimyces flavus]